MVTSIKKDKNYRSITRKFEIKRVQAKVFLQDLSLKKRIFNGQEGKKNCFLGSALLSRAKSDSILFSKVSQQQFKSLVGTTSLQKNESRELSSYNNISNKVYQNKQDKNKSSSEAGHAFRLLLKSNVLNHNAESADPTNCYIPLYPLFLIENSLASFPRNSSKTRIKNRCIETGRARSVLRFCKLSRIVLREKASKGQIPGITKASW